MRLRSAAVWVVTVCGYVCEATSVPSCLATTSNPTVDHFIDRQLHITFVGRQVTQKEAGHIRAVGLISLLMLARSRE